MERFRISVSEIERRQDDLIQHLRTDGYDGAVVFDAAARVV